MEKARDLKASAGVCVSNLPTKTSVQDNASSTISKAIKDGVITVFDSEPIQKEWLGWLKRAF